MAEFDPMRAAAEELSGLHDILRVMRLREGICEQAMGQAEVELNAIRKLRGFAQAEIIRMHAHIEELRRLRESLEPPHGP